MAKTLLIRNGLLVTWQDGDPLIEGGTVLIEDGLIREVGPDAEVSSTADVVIDAKGQLIMPGSICAHTHFYGAFARGMAIPGPAPRDFPEILDKLWWPLDQALDEDAVRLSAQVCLIDAIKHGTTTLVDHHASPNALEGSLDLIADAVEGAGLRAALCYEVTDRYGEDRAQASIDENVRFLESVKDRPHIAGLFGLHASLTVSDETLAASVKAIKRLDTGAHIHVAEHEADEYDSLNKNGVRIIDRLTEAELLNEKSIVAHAIHIDVREAELLHESGARVSHQPRSNMNNGVGAADIEGLMRLGVPVCLGNDGFTNNMWADWKAAYLLHKAWHRDPRRANGMDVVQMAIHNNAALAADLFPAEAPGYLTPGAAGDVILVDYHPTTPLSAGNLPWHILFGFESSMVTATIVAGQVLMQDRNLLTMDEAMITRKARAIVPAVWKRYATFVPS